MIRILIISLFVTASVFASTPGGDTTLSSRLSNLVRMSLKEKIAEAEIRIPSLDKLMAFPPMTNFSRIDRVRVVNDKTNGIAQFEVIGVDQNEKETSQIIQTPYEAWRKVPVALHRIYPNSKLKNEDFKIQDLNVASGSAREYRGVMISAGTNFNELQTKQSILEGQFVVETAIQKSPDLRKGDTVRLELNSGDLSLTTQAVVEESASVGSQVRVMTTKTKRELMGLVRADHSVEVNL